MAIIKDKFILSPNYKPKQLPVREELVKELIQRIKQGNYKILLAGLTGTGKTLSVENAMEELNIGKEKFLFIYVNCAECKTYSAVAKKIIETLTGKSYDERGLSKSQIVEDLKKFLLRKKTNLVFVL